MLIRGDFQSGQWVPLCLTCSYEGSAFSDCVRYLAILTLLAEKYLLHLLRLLSKVHGRVAKTQEMKADRMSMWFGIPIVIRGCVSSNGIQPEEKLFGFCFLQTC